MLHWFMILLQKYYSIRDIENLGSLDSHWDNILGEGSSGSQSWE